MYIAVETKLTELLSLIDKIELQLMSIEALVTRKWDESITKEDLSVLIQDVIEKCRHDI